MKTLIIISCVIASVANSWFAFGQTNFALRNRYAIYNLVAPILDAQGNPLEEANHLAELWGGRTPDLLKPARDGVNQRVFAPFFTPGFFRALTSPTIPDVSGPGWAWLQVRVWDIRLGTTYEEAMTRGCGGYGESPLFYALGGSDAHLGPEPQPLIGLQSFRLRPISAVLMRGIRRSVDEVIIEWHPGFKRYQLQRTAILGEAWQDTGEPTTVTITTNSITGGSQFFRVIGLLD